MKRQHRNFSETSVYAPIINFKKMGMDNFTLPVDNLQKQSDSKGKTSNRFER